MQSTMLQHKIENKIEKLETQAGHVKHAKSENPMRRIEIDKITLNIGAGAPGEGLEKAIKLLSKISGSKPKVTKTKKRIPTWGVRPGLEIGAKVTIRGKKAVEVLTALLASQKNSIPASKFDDHGNISFGIQEYLLVQGVAYDPTIGIIGFEVAITLKRPGFRIKNRTAKWRKIPTRHQITKLEAIEFMKKNFSIEVTQDA